MSKRLVVGIMVAATAWWSGCNKDSDSENNTGSDKDTASSVQDTADTATAATDTGEAETETVDPFAFIEPSSYCDGADMACYSECMMCAGLDDTLCQAEREAYENDTAGAQLKSCLADNCEGGSGQCMVALDTDSEPVLEPCSASLTGDAWETCEAYCNGLAGPDAVALRKAFMTCVYCTGCKRSCAQDGYYDCVIANNESCDEATADCYTPGVGCWGCAMKTTCKDAVDACDADDACKQLSECLDEQCNNPGLKGDEWTVCNAKCRKDHAEGIQLYDAYQKCVYCDACPTKCAQDAGDKCQ